MTARAEFGPAAGFFPARAAEYSPEVRARLETGSKIAASDYLDALEVRTALQQEFDAALKNVTAIFAPTVPVGAPKIGEESLLISGEAEDVRTALVRLNRPSNLTGLPAISLPCGFTAAGMPIGLQIIGREFDEAHLLQLGVAYQGRTDWHTRQPPLV